MRVIRLNIQDPVGRAFAEAYDLALTPSFALFDSGGALLDRRTGVVDSAWLAGLLEPDP